MRLKNDGVCSLKSHHSLRRSPPFCVGPDSVHFFLQASVSAYFPLHAISCKDIKTLFEERKIPFKTKALHNLFVYVFGWLHYSRTGECAECRADGAQRARHRIDGMRPRPAAACRAVAGRHAAHGRSRRAGEGRTGRQGERRHDAIHRAHRTAARGVELSPKMPLVSLHLEEVTIPDALARLRNGALDIAALHHMQALDSDLVQVPL